ncbi:MAG: ABC transporter ATP-binding protein [Labedaea sp.]
MRELRFEDVTVRYGTEGRGLTAVDGVNLTVPAGAVVGLVGESGSGKSTLARAAVGLTPTAGGRILLDGEPVPHRGRRPVQLVFQDPYSSLDPRMTVGSSIAETMPASPAWRRSRRGAERRAEVTRLLELVGLPADRADRYPEELSGGQRQRVGLARAIAGRPEVIIADEITSALDVSIQGAVLNLVRDLQRRLRLSILFISHDLAVVRYVSDHVAVMYLGRIVEYGPTVDVLDDPQHPYTRELLAALDSTPPSVPARPPDSQVADTEPADPHHPPPGCRFHPRCPVGPLVRTGREICLDTEPDPTGRRHRAACHFAAVALPLPDRGAAGDSTPAHR